MEEFPFAPLLTLVDDGSLALSSSPRRTTHTHTDTNTDWSLKSYRGNGVTPVGPFNPLSSAKSDEVLIGTPVKVGTQVARGQARWAGLDVYMRLRSMRLCSRMAEEEARRGSAAGDGEGGEAKGKQRGEKTRKVLGENEAEMKRRGK